LGHVSVFKLIDQLSGVLFVDVLLQPLDVAFEIYYSLLYALNIVGECLSLGEPSRVYNLDAILARGDALLQVLHVVHVFLGDGLILGLDHLQIVFVGLCLLTESLGEVVCLLRVEVNSILPIVVGSFLQLVELVLEDLLFLEQELSLIFEVILRLLDRMLIGEEVLGDLVAVSIPSIELLL